MTIVDLRPAAELMANLVRNVPDEQLAHPTPCAATNLGGLIDHVRGFAAAFAAAATKTVDGRSSRAPSADASQLGDSWRTEIPVAVAHLAEAWRDPAAWDGMTRAGGLDLPSAMAGVIALDELVLHGWDIATASGQPCGWDQATLEAVHAFVQQFSAPEAADQRAGLFGPVVPVPDDAPLLDRVLGLSGRDPAWSPPPPA
ncbi:MAG: hypothetical protein JWM12_1246 [Ilumatobacteraceae bacterium]|nr:hypothetical protein [Ilumatobacteraceae bacterium]